MSIARFFWVGTEFFYSEFSAFGYPDFFGFSEISQVEFFRGRVDLNLLPNLTGFGAMSLPKFV